MSASPNADYEGTCTHSWKTCPVHNPEGDLPPMWKVIRCVYGDYETKDGEPMSDEIAKDLNDRIWDRLSPKRQIRAMSGDYPEDGSAIYDPDSVTCRLYLAGALVDVRVCVTADQLGDAARHQAELVNLAGDPQPPYLIELDTGDGRPVRFGTDPAPMVIPIVIEDFGDPGRILEDFDQRWR
jgi:hypothetical protein